MKKKDALIVWKKMDTHIIDNFKKYFESLPHLEGIQTEAFYAEDVQFQDPIRKIKGVDNVRLYHNRFCGNLVRGGFRYTQQTLLHDKAYLSWRLELEYKVSKRRVHVSGITVLLLSDKIISHCDYYDAGALFYENLPVIGFVIRILKRQLSRGC
ncbi:nuclear transport factor 2 family protein [Dyadobacter chenwenxiniae]|uniref:Nuclear transport factor 2 family protein n=1 Tax=Dyadobacter chenwenxiniae TaxID=2906456 RepID=A0A9X1TGS4_9BACT|nr:nuclear transport factor 2 family protein [Dyadobacter chenwenxiniae]MCF0065846.1 nuclear transport factor 2 family protein [Dyadobacter chenwenxiniae]UON84092.1 nuclear transport factor 2 family protein [Dyadobacter chenwenxiniae]